MHINWNGLGEVLVVALTAGVGLVVLAALGINAFDYRTRALDRGTSTVVATATSALCAVACVALIGYGIYLTVNK
ncbi:hypothetical protein [Actinokineospora globicatena]|uniref:hypothetical protein n=1 Tax=Actinokineospora globicatena TaxID=103729 RepID=UPI0020A50AB1|nr:hypothetical protein [Actinokineospora globicatena]MCP2303734.1 hypothetical protein [Actinokineospora globicatena]GLW79117.1 hypothetical protein Aglo01_35990 [Actinokineospora globicatena]GLW86473.1 hypothetical protein Aglo02_41120 [Actinokineospora globicatena]